MQCYAFFFGVMSTSVTFMIIGRSFTSHVQTVPSPSYCSDVIAQNLLHHMFCEPISSSVF